MSAEFNTCACGEGSSTFSLALQGALSPPGCLTLADHLASEAAPWRGQAKSPRAKDSIARTLARRQEEEAGGRAGGRATSPGQGRAGHLPTRRGI